MSRAGEKLLSKILDLQDAQAIKRFNLRDHHFSTTSEREALRFIQDYADRNKGQTPDYLTVVEETGLLYEPTSDTYEYLVSQVKEFSLGVRTHEWLQKEVAPKFSSSSNSERTKFLEWLREEADHLLNEHSNRTSVGTNLKRDVDKFLQEYQRRKDGDSFRVWKSRFDTINQEIGGYASSSLIVWFGRSGRGKSMVTTSEVVSAAQQGATVLVWGMEMTVYEILARILSIVSADQGVFSTNYNGQVLHAGFRNKDLLLGSLHDEQALQGFLEKLNNSISGTIIVRGIDDEDFMDRGIRTLEHDIITTKADVVLVDPFYYLDYLPGDGTTGGAAAQTSKKLRHLAGRTRTVIHAITQAEETSAEMDESGTRSIRPPRRSEVKKTKQLLEDSTLLIGVDTLAMQGEGIIQLGKGRNGGEGVEVDLIYLPGLGIITEVPTGENVANQFLDNF
ncbi:replicative DNA helicase [Thermoactinomyces sp. DSM 45891]|uniref:AAA family ATPase n=1 Tax=unclassified Thermoactinomyces TaxID=2634588 RepID=UPI000898BDAD|nr:MULTISPECIES: AAA family ATPase [unclassified Thermoactinomyces]SDZ05639.1 replicative DNA helicase [Thermoactinomyces sp. DSM 45892]SFX48208.1 replicative DNA helicase [Thermoactinomyces sp. DSM 45891]